MKILSNYGKMMQKENLKLKKDIKISIENRRTSIKKSLGILENLSSEEIKQNLIKQREVR